MRVFVPSDDVPAEVSGIVQHVASGRATSFRGVAGLLVLLGLPAGTPLDEKSGRPEDPRPRGIDRAPPM